MEYYIGKNKEGPHTGWMNFTNTMLDETSQTKKNMQYDSISMKFKTDEINKSLQQNNGTACRSGGTD